MTREEKNQRKKEWKKKRKHKETNEKEKYKKITDRALKALYLINKDFDDKGNVLNDDERIALCGIVAERCESDFYFFAKNVLGFDLLTVETHKRWCDDLLNAISKGKKRVMRLKPRATYKTTVYGVSFVLWLWACVDPQIRIFYTSANGLLLSEVSDSIDRFLGSSKGDTLFSYIFDIVKDETAKNTSDVYNIKGRAGKGFSLVLRTSGGSTVGIHPNIIIIDDALDKNDRDSEATRQQKVRWFDSLWPLIVPFFSVKKNYYFESIFYIGTRWHMKDLCSYIFEKNKGISDKKKWDIEIESIYNKDGRSNYPEFISDEKIEEIKADISSEFFSCQYINDPLPDGTQLFDLKRLRLVRPEQIDLHLGQLLCVFDPSKGKSHNDFPAVWWLHYKDDIITFFDAIDKKIEITLLIHQIAARNKMHGCRTILFEDNNAFLLEDALEKAHNRINWRMNIETTHHGSESNKHERIISMQPELYSGHVQFMSDYENRYPEAINQIIFYPVYGNDDFPDCAQMGIEYFRQTHFTFHRYEEYY